MGLTCSKSNNQVSEGKSNVPDVPDPEVYELLIKSVEETQPECVFGQQQLLYKHQHQQQRTGKRVKSKTDNSTSFEDVLPFNFHTRLILRQHAVRQCEEGLSGTHIYAVRWTGPDNISESVTGMCQEQCPRPEPPKYLVTGQEDREPKQVLQPRQDSDNGDQVVVDPFHSIDHLFRPATMAAPPKQTVVDWVTVSEEHNIFVADVGLTVEECNHIVSVTEQVCKGQYSAYTYAKQTLGCREFPPLAVAVQDAVHTITNAIIKFSADRSDKDGEEPLLVLDDREPHMVKYDVTRKERQKLDMHTDKSEWTFLVSLSNGCLMDYSGGGTYFECLDATVHLQRGHALVFPGKLRHCGQRITSGLRFLLVGFLVDKTPPKVEEEDDKKQQRCVSSIP